MEKHKIPATAAPYIAALRELIRTGAIASPTLETSCLIDLPIVHKQSGARATPAKRAFVFIQILQHVIRQRLEGKDTETATILFGFGGYAGVPIQDRYRTVAKLYNTYWSWENYRKEPLTRHLLAVYLALEREAELTHHTFTVGPKPARSGLVGQDWVLEKFDGLYSLPHTEGQPLETIQIRRLRATCDEIQTYRHYASVRERGVSALPQVQLFGPGTATITDSHVDTNGIRTYVTEVAFPKPIRFGESVEFTLIKRVPVQYGHVIQKKGWDWYGLISLASPAESVKIGLRFPPHALPREVWRHQDIMSGLVRPGAPTTANRRNIDESGFTTCTWTDLSAGYSYGISLEW